MQNEMHKNPALIILLACGLVSISIVYVFIVYVLLLPIVLILALDLISKLIEPNAIPLNDLSVLQSLISVILLVLGIYVLLSAWQVLSCYTKTGFTTRPTKISQIGLLIGLLLLIPLNISLYSTVWLSPISYMSNLGWIPPSQDSSSIIVYYFLGFMVITAPLLTALTLTYLLYYPYLYKQNRIMVKSSTQQLNRSYKSLIIFIIKAGLFSPTAVYVLLSPWLFYMVLIDLAAVIKNSSHIPALSMWVLLIAYGLGSCWHVFKHYKATDFATQANHVWNIGMAIMLSILLYWYFLIEEQFNLDFSNIDVVLTVFLVIIAPMISILILFSLFFITKLKNLRFF